MAEKCKWKTCEEEEEKSAFIVKFSNGSVKNTNQFDLTLYRNIDNTNPRKKTRRIVVAESDRLAYVGSNFGTGSLQCNKLCKYFVGVLDKTTKQMVVHNAQLFNMQAAIPGESVAEDTDKSQTKSYRDKVDSLIEAFGTNKQKRALNSRRLNEVGNETLHLAVAKAAGSIIEQKGIEALQQEVAATEAQADSAVYLPQFNAEAKKPEDVYPFDGLLSPVEYAALEEPGQKMEELTSEDLQKMRDSSPQTVLYHLECLPKEGEARTRQARCVWYLSLLIKLAHERNITRKFGTEEGCPRIIQNKVMKNFTVESFSKSRVKNVVSDSMHVKLASHCLALLLHMGDFTADITQLHRDLGISENRMLEVAKAMRLKLGRLGATNADAEIGDEHKLVTLVLPLVKYERRVERRKRKKMT
ncbi:DNA-directed RNA polymerase I subunit RPA49 [Chanos chanos]|uniref:DNA-directed RNA polymerase I subunit RPA49 n=1 Tax=Chanos chanos TaxID=29144 RepID=A0A6J2WI75_CHACN|nr:DNA-directed RNA polymerase I subunit RPA49 [Chanos chanos]